MARTHTTSARLAVGALCLAAVAGGCGDDDSPGLSAAELRASADEICEAGAKRFAKVQARPAATPKQAKAQTTELIELASAELADLGELSPPEELAEPYEAYLSSRGRLLELLESGRDAAAAADAAAYTKVRLRAIEGRKARARLAEAAGLKECSASN